MSEETKMPLDNDHVLSNSNSFITTRQPYTRQGPTMTLTDIRQLSNKRLLSLFSESSSNELTRNFAYTCFFIPDECAAIFTSFGNDSRARSEMTNHLTKHILKFIVKENADPNFKFTAQTVQALRKSNKLSEKSKAGRDKSKITIEKDLKTKAIADTPLSANGQLKKKYVPKKNYYREKKEAMLRAAHGINTTVAAADKGDNHALPNSSRKLGELLPIPKVRIGRAAQPCSSQSAENMQRVVETVPIWEEVVKSEAAVGVVKSETAEPSSFSDEDECSVVSGMSKMEAESIMSLLDEMLQRQPFQDHSYAARLPPLQPVQDSSYARRTRLVQGWQGEVSSFTEDDEDDVSPDVFMRLISSRKATPNMLVIPMIQIRRTGYIGDEVVGVRVEGRDWTSTTGSDDFNHRLYNEESVEPASSDEEMVDGRALGEVEESEKLETLNEVTFRKLQILNNTSSDERVQALQYIQELRGRRKALLEDTDLTCRICMNKHFTAVATLLYHYRSHAGIKPFTCDECGTTFTRQHSLNYHMLIHKNENRFTCSDCGRMFRHPSHYREHLRRHTGETPFNCIDCTLSFKTRNTYKRHLRTRHGKLLLASGIHLMPAAEFAQIRTKEYHRRSTGEIIPKPINELSKMKYWRDDRKKYDENVSAIREEPIQWFGEMASEEMQQQDQSSLVEFCEDMDNASVMMATEDNVKCLDMSCAVTSPQQYHLVIKNGRVVQRTVETVQKFEIDIE